MGLHMSCEKDQIVTMSLLHHISIQSHIEIGQTNHCFSSNRKLYADSTRVESRNNSCSGVAREL